MLKTRHILFWGFLMAGVCGILFFTPSCPAAAEPLYIGVAGPMSGEDAKNGKTMLEGIRLCIDAVNQAGGIDGRPVALRILDDKNDKKTARNAARELAETDDVLLVLGHYYSSTSVAAGEIYEAVQIPAITASATADAVTRHNDWYFKMLPGNAFQGSFIAHYISKVLKKKGTTIISDQDTYGSTLARSFEQTARNLSVEIRAKWEFDAEDENWDEKWENFLKELKQLNDPGMIFLAVHASEGVKILTSLKNPGTPYEIIGPDAFSGEAFFSGIRETPLERAKPGYYSDDIYAVTPFIIDLGGAKAQAFREAFRQAYGREPSWVAAGYYDAARLATEAIQKAGISGLRADIRADRRKIRDHMAGIRHAKAALRGVMGPIFFNAYGDVMHPYAIGIYKKQKLISAPIQYQLLPDIRQIGNLLKEVLDGQIIIIDRQPLTQTRVVYTGVDINEISDLDQVDQSYAIDFYLWFRYQGEFDCENVEFINAESLIELDQSRQKLRLSNDIITKLGTDKSDGFTTHAYRIRATFQSDFDFHAYPFDRQQLFIRFRHATLTRDQLIYVSDVMGMRHFLQTGTGDDPEYNSIPGWVATRESFYQDVIVNDSTLGMPRFFNSDNSIQYSQFNVAIDIERQVLGFLFKDIFSVFIMFMTLYIVYFISGDQFELRLSIGMGVLMTNAFLHQDVSGSLQVGYLLAIDHAFFTVYVLSTLSILMSLIGSDLCKKGYEKRSHLLNIAGRIIHPAVIAVVTGVMIYTYVL